MLHEEIQHAIEVTDHTIEVRLTGQQYRQLIRLARIEETASGKLLTIEAILTTALLEYLEGPVHLHS